MKKQTKSFKAEMNLPKLIEQFGDDTKCRARLTQLRWPKGVACPRCESKSISRVIERDQYDCNRCRYQFSATSGTIFHDTHLPLSKWFLAIYFMTESKKGMSALQMKRTLAVSSNRCRLARGRLEHARLARSRMETGQYLSLARTFYR